MSAAKPGREALVAELRNLIEWVDERDHDRAVALDQVVHDLETRAAAAERDRIRGELVTLAEDAEKEKDRAASREMFEASARIYARCQGLRDALAVVNQGGNQ